MRSLPTLLVASLLSLGACLVQPAPGEGPPPVAHPVGAAPMPSAGQLYGVVTDARTHAPVDRVAIDVSGPQISGVMTFTTDDAGRFETRGVPPGEYGLRVRRKGYQEMTREHVEIRPGKTELNIELMP